MKMAGSVSEPYSSRETYRPDAAGMSGTFGTQAIQAKKFRQGQTRLGTVALLGHLPRFLFGPPF